MTPGTPGPRRPQPKSMREALFHKRKLLYIAGGIGFALALVYALVAPKWYEATLALIPAPQDNDLGGMAAAASAIGAELPIDVGIGSTTDSDRIQGVLKSRTVSDAVIHKFNLVGRYKVEYIEQARKALWKHCDTKIEKRSQILTLTCEDKDPATAQQLAAYFSEFGNDVFRKIQSATAGEERRFLERRVKQAREEADDAARAVRDFQEKYRIIDIGEQGKAVVSELASLQGALLSKELQLSYMKTFTSSDEASSERIGEQLALMRAKMRSLEGQATGDPSTIQDPAKSNANGLLFPQALKVPKLRFELERLLRDQKLEEVLFIMLVQKFEMARVKEARDTSAFVVLDEPVLPTMHVWPKRGLVVLLGMLLGLFIGGLIVIIRFQLSLPSESTASV